MKNFVKVLCFTLAFIIAVSGGLYGYIQWYKTDFEFTDGTEKDTVMITGYNGTDKDVKIPSKIRGKKVTKIDSLVFEDSDITSVKIDDNITYIGKSCFRGCKSLKSVKLGKNVKNIDEGCFDACSSLEKIVFPASLEQLGISLFSGCTALKEVKFESNEYFTIQNGVVFSSDMKTLIFALPYAKLGAYVCPESVTKIYDGAFYGCTALTGFTFSKNVTTVPRAIFALCTSLKELVIPETITKISSLITTDSSVTRITVPASVKEIDDLAFYDSENENNVSENLTMVTVKGSKAEEFAKANGMKIEYIK